MSALLSDDNTIKTQPFWTAHKNEIYVLEVRGVGQAEWHPMTEEMLGIGSGQKLRR
ncbi:hypothetical protein [Dyadobacter sp. CY347]|uniref:hypothetical protein n=1 Tax=Dyadobacter sp. CY347 TaxID=2909336 RepID=UPI001F3733DB|nr:hypothetical protein [Dyadobacter sp. CY347]MCF2491521.1 hypothetical protein [Dyadobacter sp. CY347]